MRIFIRIVTAAALAAATTSCGSAVRTGSASMFLAMDSLKATRGSASGGASATSTLDSDVQTLVTSGGACSSQSPCPIVFPDSGVASLRLVPKNPISGPAPSSTNDITVSRIHVEYRRTDGRNTPGVDVPFPYDTFVTQVVSSGGANVSFELVRAQAKIESPLAQLVSNGQMIGVIADVTLYGLDRAGNTASVSGSIQIQFANFGDF